MRDFGCCGRRIPSFVVNWATRITLTTAKVHQQGNQPGWHSASARRRCYVVWRVQGKQGSIEDEFGRRQFLNGVGRNDAFVAGNDCDGCAVGTLGAG